MGELGRGLLLLQGARTQRKGSLVMRGVGIFMGALTFVAGTTIISGGIIGVFRNLGSVADLGKGLGNTIALLLVFSVACLLASPDGFYRRHPRLIAASAAIATIGGSGFIVAAFFHPAFQEASFGASFAAFFVLLAGILALADAAVLFIRSRMMMKSPDLNKAVEIEAPPVEDDL